MNKGYRDSKNSIYKYIFIYTILWAFFTPSWRFKNKNVTTWQCDNVTTWQRTKPSSSPTHPTTNNAKSYKPIIYTICDSYLQLFNPCPLVTFYSCQRRLHTLLLPSLLAKKLEKREEIPKKMRNFVGSFDCIDKLKYALRQAFAQQKQLSTRVFSGSEAEPTTRKKKSMMKRNYLTTNHFVGMIPQFQD